MNWALARAGNSAGALRLLTTRSSIWAVEAGMGTGDAKERVRVDLMNWECEKALRLDSVRLVGVDLGILGMTVVVT